MSDPVSGFHVGVVGWVASTSGGTVEVGRTTSVNGDVVCGKGRQIVFVDVADVLTLDLTDMSRALMPVVLGVGGRAVRA